jgi:hypothetical protein
MFDLAEALKFVPGNKSLILFTSRGLGVSLGKAFASASTPVYTVNTRNWISQGVRTKIKKKHIFTDHPLKELALASGGKYFADIEDVETISRDVQTLTGNFYVLGYYVPETWDGAYHEIKVNVKNPDLKVLAQDGYFNPKPYSELTDFEKQLHLLDLAFTEKATSFVRLDIPVEPLFIADRKEANCAFLARIFVDEKSGIPPANVEIFAFLFDKDKNPVMTKKGEMNLSPFNQKTLYPYFAASLSPGKYECRIVARDLQSGQAVVGKTTFSLPEPIDSEIILSSPLLFVSGPESPILRLSQERSQKQREKGPSLSDFYKLLPKKHCLVVKEMGTEVKNLLAVLPASVAEEAAPEVEFTVRLHPKPDGEPVDLKTEIIDVQKADANTDILMMEIVLPVLKRGEYELEIEAVDEHTEARFFVRKSLEIK